MQPVVFYNYLSLSLKQNPTMGDSYHLKQYQTEFEKENTNFFFTITDETGMVILTNYVEQDFGTQETYSIDPDGRQYGKVYAVNTYIKDPITAKDNYYVPYQLSLTLFSMRYIIIAIVILLAIFSILFFIFLIYSAGHNKGREGITLRSGDRIPFDLYAMCAFLIGICQLVLHLARNERNPDCNDYLSAVGCPGVFCSPALYHLCCTGKKQVNGGKIRSFT